MNVQLHISEDICL